MSINKNDKLKVINTICELLNEYEKIQRDAEHPIGPAEVTAFSFLKTFADMFKYGVRGNRDDAWYSERLKYWKVDASTGLDSAPTNFVETLLNDFSDGFSQWVESKYGKKDFVYVPNTYDRESIEKEIVPYLRVRANRKPSVALEVWKEIVANYFLSDLRKWDSKPPSLREMSQYLTELELQPIGDSKKPTLYGYEKAVADAFLAYKPTGSYTSRDVKALLAAADDVDDAVECIQWMFSDAVTDDFLKNNRPYTLGFIVRMWNLYDAYKKHKPDPVKQENAKAELKAMLKKIS